MNSIMFEKQLSDLFCGGECRCRELRLTPAEHDYLVRMYPAATLTPMGENWYELAWKEAR